MSAPGCVPTGAVRHHETAATLRTLPAISSAVAVPSLLEDVPIACLATFPHVCACLGVSCSGADTWPAWRGKKFVASWSGAAVFRPAPGGASRASYQLFPPFPAVVAAGFAVGANETGWGEYFGKAAGRATCKTDEFPARKSARLLAIRFPFFDGSMIRRRVFYLFDEPICRENLRRLNLQNRTDQRGHKLRRDRQGPAKLARRMTASGRFELFEKVKLRT